MTKKDLKDNRTKRIFNDPVGIKASKTRNRAFCRNTNGIQEKKIWDISNPVFIKGKHWGAFRVGLSLEKINQEKNQATFSLSLIMFLILIVSFLAVYFSVSRVLKPVEELTEVTKWLMVHLEKKMKVNTIDEIGKLADVLERLRFSLKAALERMARKNGQ